MHFIDFSDFNFAPFIIFIILGIILIIVIEKIGSSVVSSAGGGGHFGSGGGKNAANHIVNMVANSASNAAAKRRQQEAAQRALIRQIKITGLVAGFAFIIALSSLFAMIGAFGKEDSYGTIIISAAGLIMGAVFTLTFSIRFFQLKRQYELYYGSIFGKKQ